MLFGLIISTILGMGWGSFATMAIYRIPRGIPWIGDKPRCPLCKHELSIMDYVSLFSYFLRQGTCRYCNGHFACRASYFWTELLMTAQFILAFFLFDLGSDPYVMVTSIGIAAIIALIIDAEHQHIPAKVLISLLCLAIIARMWQDHQPYTMLANGSMAALIMVTLRYLYYRIKNNPKAAKDFLEWKPKDRFNGPGFDYVKLGVIISIILPLPLFFWWLGGSLITTLLWQYMHPKSLRIGSIMIGWLMAFLY